MLYNIDLKNEKERIMKKVTVSVFRMTLGFFLCACGIVMALNSNLGLSPWDVFHQGLSNVTGITMGQASILVGVLIVVITYFLGLEVGIGTLANMIVIGFFIDLIIYLDFIPETHNLYIGLFMIVASLFMYGLASYLYLGCELGCGPRDGLMIILVKRTGKPVGLIRLFIESGALIIGYALGGTVGIGTLITALGIGFSIQLVFKLFKFDVNALNHRSIKQTFKIKKTA